MRQSFDNKLISSFYLWADYLLTHSGQAFTNTGVLFYSNKQTINGYYTYTSPYKPFVADSFAPNAQVPTGIYLNNALCGTGVSGFAGYNFNEGYAYFTSPVPNGVRISGNLSIKDYQIQLTSKADEDLIFETKYQLRPKVAQSVTTGLAPGVQTIPIVYLKK